MRISTYIRSAHYYEYKQNIILPITSVYLYIIMHVGYFKNNFKFLYLIMFTYTTSKPVSYTEKFNQLGSGKTTFDI